MKVVRHPSEAKRREEGVRVRACPERTINEVVAVLLIHIEMKAVRLMKPAKSRRGEWPISNTT